MKGALEVGRGEAAQREQRLAMTRGLTPDQRVVLEWEKGKHEADAAKARAWEERSRAKAQEQKRWQAWAAARMLTSAEVARITGGNVGAGQELRKMLGEPCIPRTSKGHLWRLDRLLMLMETREYKLWHLRAMLADLDDTAIGKRLTVIRRELVAEVYESELEEARDEAWVCASAAAEAIREAACDRARDELKVLAARMKGARPPRVFPTGKGSQRPRKGVYAAWHPAWPDMVKIGKGSGEGGIERRVEDLGATLPTSYKVVAEMRTAEAAKWERILHVRLKKYRINPRREYFLVPYKNLIDAFKKAGRQAAR